MNMLQYCVAPLLVLAFVMQGCNKIDRLQPSAMLNEDLQCGDGSQAEIARWGGIDKNGWTHSCKMAHGAYHVWENGILIIKGQYIFGKKNGVWIYQDAKQKKIMIYKDGRLIETKIVKD